VTVVRPLPVFGFYGVPDRASEVVFENVRVPVANILLGEGRGFEIAQGRLGPGRIHHCMRLIGLAERSLELMCKRASSRVAFGRTVAEQGVTRERIAEARCRIDMARLLTLKAAWIMDVAGNKTAKAEIAMIKVVAPSMALQVIDWAMQAHGGGGVCEDFPLAGFYAGARRPFSVVMPTFGNITSQRISSGVLVPIWVCTLSVNSSKVWRSSASISVRDISSICMSDGRSSSMRRRNSWPSM
jgi:acyl-CoA dehydrogenase